MNKKLYVDESGHTGSTLYKNNNFNFVEQPYFVLSGILLNDEENKNLENFVNALKIKHEVMGTELKAKNLYNTKDKFINELISYILDKKISIFIELIDKKHYINIQIFEVIAPSNRMALEKLPEEYFESAINCIYELSNYLDDTVYDFFSQVLHDYTNDSLEKFYEFLINKFQSSNLPKICKLIEDTKKDYFIEKKIDPKSALDSFLPIPSINSRGKLIFLLPNFHAFTNIVGTVNKYCENNKKIYSEIIHDSQEQYDSIFDKVFNDMKNINYTIYAPNFVNKKTNFSIPHNTTLSFCDSKNHIAIQVSDIISGTLMRWWTDFINKEKNSDSAKYLNSIYNLHNKINFVVPKNNFDYFNSLITYINSNYPKK